MDGQPSFVVELLNSEGMEMFLGYVGQQDQDVSWLQPLRKLYDKTHAWLQAEHWYDFVTRLQSSMQTRAAVTQMRTALQCVIREYESISESYAARRAGADVAEQLKSFAIQLKKYKDSGTLEFCRGQDGKMTVRLICGQEQHHRCFCY